MPFEEAVVGLVNCSREKNDVFDEDNVISELQNALRKTISEQSPVLHGIEASTVSMIQISKIDDVMTEKTNGFAENRAPMVECDSGRDFGSISSIEESESNSSEKGCMLSKSQNNRVRRLFELRQTRRNMLLHDEVVEFDCSPEEFPEKLSTWYEGELKESKKESVFLYRLIVNNCLAFAQKTNIEGSFESFFLNIYNNNLLRSNKDLSEKYSENTSLGLLEIQVQILLELHALTLVKNEDCVDMIIKNLRSVYIWSDPATMKSFLEDQICDLFIHSVPRELSTIFEDLCVTLPADLEEYNLEEPPTNDSETWFSKQPNENQLKELNKIIEETSLSESGNDSTIPEKKKAKRLEAGEKKLAISPTKAVRSLRKIPKVIPDTPEDKLKAKELLEETADVVKQTPMGKLRGVNKKGSKRLSELVKLSEERTRPIRAVTLAAEKAARALINSSVAPNANKQLLLGLNTPSPRPQRTARSNLIDRFVATPDPSTRRSPRKALITCGKRPISQESSASNDNKRTKLDFSTVDKTPEKKATHIGPIAGFTPEQLKRYKQRMLEISKSKVIEKIDDAESRQRTSLFEDPEIKGAKVDQKNVQKNRTGRMVRAPSSTVHIAHILLNVHNSAPLDPFKASKVAGGPAPKLQKLVRIAKKKEKIKLNRLRNRGRAQPSSPSSSQKSDSVD